jgi:hypothetical protein
MPVYSISRTSQYTTVSVLETKGNQDGYSWNGFDLTGYGATFSVTYTTVCPTVNRVWDYADPANPDPHYVWYPYSITLTVSGGNPYDYSTSTAQGYRPGFAYLKLYSSTGTYLMGSSPTNTLTNASTATIFLTTGPSVQANTFTISNSRITLSLTANTTYVAGFSSPSTGTAFWNVFARTTGQAGQNIYYDSTSVTATGPMSLATVSHSTQSLMGFITYNAAPRQPTSLVITNTNTGISITCQSDEAQSFISGVTLSAVNKVKFFYSETLTGTYNNLGNNTSTITRTLISGTTYQYVATFEGGTTLTQGKKYYFKVATMNDVCTRYEIDVAGSIPASEQSTAVRAIYGSANVVRVRNPGNSDWTTIDVKVRNTIGGWNTAGVARRNAANTEWLYN